MIKIFVAVYKNDDYKILETPPTKHQISRHYAWGARFAEVEIDFEKLPIPHLEFGKGIVLK